MAPVRLRSRLVRVAERGEEGETGEEGDVGGDEEDGAVGLPELHPPLPRRQVAAAARRRPGQPLPVCRARAQPVQQLTSNPALLIQAAENREAPLPGEGSQSSRPRCGRRRGRSHRPAPAAPAAGCSGPSRPSGEGRMGL